MSNLTPQQIANKGFTVIGQNAVQPADPAVVIPALAGTNKIILQIQGVSQPVYLGDSAVQTDGILLYSLNDTPIKTPLILEILTDTPEEFYLYTVAASDLVNIIYLAYNT